MSGVIRFAITEVMPASDVVLMRAGMPRRAAVSAAVAQLLADASEAIVDLAEPRGIFEPVATSDFQRLFRTATANAPETPLDEIVPRATALALFVGTIGAKVEKKIAELFAKGDPPLAAMLDAAASEMANAVAGALAARFGASLREGARVLPYSPGYCGWHVSGQRALFGAIDASATGVTLGESCLMNPLKSVSGVLIAGDAETHRFRPRWTFCEECAGRDCGPRMASVR